MKRACVVGWPIEHSRSPVIHGYWLRHYGIDGAYDKRAVTPEALPDFLAGMAADGLVGCNVTVPHKERAFELADWRDGAAQAVGAANTLWLDGDRLCASNTDTYGFMTHLSQSAPGWNDGGRPAVLLGAGGAARAILYGLQQAGVTEIRLLNRTAARAEELAAHYGGSVVVLDWQRRGEALAGSGLLVNTTTLGMTGVPALELSLQNLPADAVVADIVYAPLETPLLASARVNGCRCVDGLGMLLHQAVPGFERWFGVRPAVTPKLRNLIVADLLK